MLAALAIVKVGKTEWEFSKRTPFLRSAAIAGAFFSLMSPGRKPSATNKMMLCGFSSAIAQLQLKMQIPRVK